MIGRVRDKFTDEKRSIKLRGIRIWEKKRIRLVIKRWVTFREKKIIVSIEWYKKREIIKDRRRGWGEKNIDLRLILRLINKSGGEEKIIIKREEI